LTNTRHRRIGNGGRHSWKRSWARFEDEDKSGEEPEEIVAAGDGVYEVLGGTEIGKIERLFDMEIEADDFTTIAGLVIAQTGSLPRPERV